MSIRKTLTMIPRYNRCCPGGLIAPARRLGGSITMRMGMRIFDWCGLRIGGFGVSKSW